MTDHTMNIPLTIEEAVAAIQGQSLTPLELAAECLQRIERFEPEISAWVLVDAEGALQQAERLTHESNAGKSSGPLHGIPIAIKDIVDVAGMPTRAGSSLTSDRPAAADAPVVARLRAAGAVILGKTVTTEFACFDPPPTKNPWNAARTPGGSSSGSAAAVALGMCPGAIGSQTGGSITRPASYCGIAGVKPTFGRVSRVGVVPLADHLDHVGPMARTAADCELLLRAIADPDARDSAGRAASDSRGDVQPSASAVGPRLGVIHPYFFETAEAETAELTEAALRALKDGGAHLVELPLPELFDAVHTMHRRIMYREGAEYHRHKYGAPRAGYGPQMAALIEEGLAVTMEAYQEALRHQAAFRDAIERALAEVDAAVIPSTPGPAPDPSTTGDPRFNSPWSHAGVPTVSIPCALTKAGLPVSLQLVGRAWSDWRLLRIAAWCEERLRFRCQAPLLAEGAEAG
jgi:Asp-tRNA(Asn)/Glu-tRNA(Gln) amidotransferase A subunit family amidase